MASINEERDRDCVRALFITDPSDDMEAIQNKQDKVLEGTGAWLLSDQAFTKWLNEDESSLLWLHGDPGKGKTMLAISMVKELAKRTKLQSSASPTALAYFFCDSKDTRRQTCTTILRGLIYQLICQRPELCAHLRDQYDKQKELLFSSPNAAQTLWRIFCNITSSESLQQVYIVLDALDECDSGSIETLLTFIDPPHDTASDDETDIVAIPTELQQTSKVKWLITSRNELAIQQMLAGVMNISMEQNHSRVSEAVQQFVVFKVAQLQRRKRYDKNLGDFVRGQLLEKAEGTFLWVSLASRELSKPRVLSVNTSKVLSGLPSGLTSLYERIMEQILSSEDEELAEHAKSILRAMVVAFKPLTFSELGIAAKLPHRRSMSVISEYVNQCGSMVTIRDYTVYFVHLSAKTFIQSMKGTAIVSPKLGLEHEFLALNCFTYLCEETFNDHARAETGYVEPEYPSRFWLDHTRCAPSAIVQQFDLDNAFFRRDSVPRQAWFESYWKTVHANWESCPSNFSAIHLAAYACLPSFVDAFLAHHHHSDISALDSLGNTSLLWAARNGCTQVVQRLLEAGCDRRAVNNEGMTALQWAASNGHADIVELLFDGKESIQVRDNSAWTPLHRASYNGHVEVVRLLLNLGADSEELDGSTWTPLIRSSSNGHPAVVKLLLDRKASIHALDREGMNPMLHAAWSGHAQIVKMHMDHGADVNTADFNGWTVLHNAAWNGHSDAVRFLLNQKVDLQARCSDGSTPLHHAAWSGHVGVANLLLGGGANVNAENEDGETPLQQAAWRGHTLTAQALLDARGDIDKTNAVGHTALHQAASSGEEEVIVMLLARGADPTLLDKHGQSARALAEVDEHDASARLIKARERAMGILSESAGTPVEESHVDPAVASALGIDAKISTVQPHQAAGFFVPEKLTTKVDGSEKLFYIKSGANKEMFESEFVSLTLLHEIVPTLAPKPLAWGKYEESETWYLVTEWIDMNARNDGCGSGTGLTLAQKVARLHTTPARIPEGHTRPMFGFPITTYCGSTPQENTYCGSWAKFYSEHRLRALARIIEENHGTDKEFTDALNVLIEKVVPRLLGNGHLGGKQGVIPVLIHGDLWEGNKGKGAFDDRQGVEPVTFDPSCCYAHSEFELGLMRMFGGFSASFFNEYHHLVPKTEPKREYEDRMALYELYHYMNHYAIYAGGYREDVMDSVKKLCKQYAGDNEETEE
ncbi:MAG: hypothetical protein M1828_004746 [Chrysothrix sp. TS-e1954]|nr:MAG: hypothetical protein M1828_004746 [Chrysothrix sp. TS-e1954]